MHCIEYLGCPAGILAVLGDIRDYRMYPPGTPRYPVLSPLARSLEIEHAMQRAKGPLEQTDYRSMFDLVVTIRII